MTLPEDVETIVTYLRAKATGATVDDAKAALSAKLLDGRKVSGYLAWGFVKEDEGRLKLTERGRRLDRASSEGQKAEIYREVVEAVRPYRMAAEWIHYQGFEVVPVADLAAHWVEHVPEALGTESERGIRERVTCFYNLAQAGGLGDYIKGRGSKSTRLEVDQEGLSQFIAEMALEPSGAEAAAKEEEEPPEEVEPPEAEEGQEAEELRPGPGAAKRATRGAMKEAAGGEPEAEVSSVFIAHGKNKKILDQVETVLDAAGLEFEVAEKEETTAIPVSDKVFQAMRRCQAAVICVTADEQAEAEEEQDEAGETGKYTINENVLIEVGAAFLLYEKRVVLVWDRRLDIPSNLRGLYRCEFEGDELGFEPTMKLLNAVGKFKKSEALES